MKRGTIQDHFIHSAELGEDVSFLVYVPADFSPMFSYTFLICQDGKDYFQLGRLPRLADELLEAEEIEPLIMVGIPYLNKHDRREKYHPDGVQQAAYIRFLANELVPYLDEQFPGHGNRFGRALAGDSLAGTVSFMTALKHPDLFGRVLMHSPFVDSTVMNLAESAETLPSLYHVIGTEETDVLMTNGERADFLTPNRALSSLLSGKRTDYFYEEFAGNHTWTYWQKDMKRALLKMFE
ncbi:alpha/beta hydrolase-fold protein [Domibacillus sp. 8LH]|uniref:alpha/beta hydrolase n=1 Tax=Domibacillus sp. 8LH TaxID=3073900 RepID=UPI00316DB4E4